VNIRGRHSIVSAIEESTAFQNLGTLEREGTDSHEDRTWTAQETTRPAIIKIQAERIGGDLRRRFSQCGVFLGPRPKRKKRQRQQRNQHRTENLSRRMGAAEPNGGGAAEQKRWCRAKRRSGLRGGKKRQRGKWVMHTIGEFYAIRQHARTSTRGRKTTASRWKGNKGTQENRIPLQRESGPTRRKSPMAKFRGKVQGGEKKE